MINRTTKTEYVYIGMDIHKESHTAVMLTYMEEELGKITIENNVSGFRRLLAYVNKHKQNYTPMYGLEDVTHHGRSLAIYMLEKDYIVKEVNSALSFMERKSYPTTRKNDSWDARCIASVLSRRYETLPDANPQDYYWTMRHLVNRRDALVKNKTALLQQFHDQIQNNYPSYKGFFHEIEGKTSLAFYEHYPSPGKLEGMTVEELGAFFRIPSRNVCSEDRAEKILTLVQKDAVKERDYQYARDAVIQGIIRNIRFNREEMTYLEKIEKQLLCELGYHLETIPGVNTVTASALVAHIGDIKRFSSADKLANFAGVAPKRNSSAGKGKDEQNKTQGNRELYNVLYFLAINQVCIDHRGTVRNPVLRAYFEYKISQGKTKVQALICIMRRLVNIIYSMMKNKTSYRLPEVVETAETAGLTKEKEMMIS